jgi:hypothetical protein
MQARGIVAAIIQAVGLALLGKAAWDRFGGAGVAALAGVALYRAGQDLADVAPAPQMPQGQRVVSPDGQTGTFIADPVDLSAGIGA